MGKIICRFTKNEKKKILTALNRRIAIRLWYNCYYTIIIITIVISALCSNWKEILTYSTVLLWYIIICNSVMPLQKCFPQIVFAAITEQEQTHCCHVHIHTCYTISAQECWYGGYSAS